MQVPYTANWSGSWVIGLNLFALILQSRIAVDLAEPIVFRSAARADVPPALASIPNVSAAVRNLRESICLFMSHLP